MHQAMKIPDAKAAVNKEWKKLETIPAWQFGQSWEPKIILFWKHQETKKKVHFATLMDIFHRKNAELEPQFQKRRGRLVLRGDIVKDDAGACAVSAGRGSSASQMTAARVMDVMARLPDSDWQAADAASA